MAPVSKGFHVALQIVVNRHAWNRMLDCDRGQVPAAVADFVAETATQLPHEDMLVRIERVDLVRVDDQGDFVRLYIGIAGTGDVDEVRDCYGTDPALTIGAYMAAVLQTHTAMLLTRSTVLVDQPFTGVDPTAKPVRLRLVAS